MAAGMAEGKAAATRGSLPGTNLTAYLQASTLEILEAI